MGDTEVDTKEFAEVSDLLQGSEGTKDIEILGKKLQIRKVTVGEVADILKVSKDSEIDQYIWLVFKGVIKPKMKVDEVKKLPTGLTLLIAAEISKFSELDKESIAKLENLFQIKP